jgi:sigma-B regulation protein RsbU (phosphoserine phosphatase)
MSFSRKSRGTALRMKLSFRARILAATLLLVSMALIAAGIAFYSSAESAIRRATADHLRFRASEILDTSVRYQSERLAMVDTWSTSDALQSTIDTGDPKFAEDYLKRSLAANPDTFGWAVVVDGESRIVAAVASGAPPTSVESVRGRTLASRGVDSVRERGAKRVALEALQLLPGGSPDAELVLACPIVDFTGEQVGVLAVVLTRRGIERFLAELTHAADASFIPVLFDADSRFVATAADRALPAASFVALADGAWDSELSGARYLGARTSRPASESPRWSAVVMVPQEVALAELHWLRRTVAIAFLAVLALICGASVLALRHAVRPLSEISESMGRVARGDLAVRLRQPGDDDLGRLVGSFNTMVAEVERAQKELQRTESLRREVEIARTIQTSILPRSMSLNGFELAARMRPASEVGGDFYDVISNGDGFWLVVGDVSGHGLNAGLVMLMAQAALHSAIAARPDAPPREVVIDVNRMLHENVRTRMGSDDYVTLMVVRHLGGGRFITAGSHQPCFVMRADGAVQVVEPQGPWCGLVPEIGPTVVETRIALGPGEGLWLISDGLIEAKNASGHVFGEERLVAAMRAVDEAAPAEAVSRVFAAIDGFASSQGDDMTLLMLRRHAEPALAVSAENLEPSARIARQ